MRPQIVIAAGLALAGTAHAAKFGIQMKKGFEVFSIDDKGGGWVIHHAPGRGDSLWACADLAKVDSCKQVYFDAWRVGASLEFLHVNEKTQSGWLVIKAPGMSHTIHACKDPEGSPSCMPLELDLLPKLSSIERTWPDKACDFLCGDDAVLLKDDDAKRIMEPASYSDIWIQAGPPGVGPANMYACRGLDATPTCQLAVPNWLSVDRDGIGISKFEDVEVVGPDGEDMDAPGVSVAKIDEESAAFAAGLREGSIILKVGGFTTDDPAKARAMFAQYPAEQPIEVTLDNGQVITVTPVRKPKKK